MFHACKKELSRILYYELFINNLYLKGINRKSNKKSGITLINNRYGDSKMSSGKYYFSEGLKRQLSEVGNYPLTVVEAPSGFGKTTAIREYLNCLPQGILSYWYTCLGEPAPVVWHGICSLLANADSRNADKLKALEMPTMETLPFIISVIRDIKCESEIYLVMDNYHLVNCGIPRELMQAFSMHQCSSLHFIIISQQLRKKQRFFFHNANIHIMDSNAFMFDKESIDTLFRMEGMRLADGELNCIHQNTGGWVSALRLQMVNYLETGSFKQTVNIERLVKCAIWDRLTAEERSFFLSLSILDSFTAGQAAMMIGKKSLPEKMEELLDSHDFIWYFPEKNSYAMHNILKNFLQDRFIHHKPRDFQIKMFNQAGRSCASISLYYSAAQFYFKAENYEAILLLPFDTQYLGANKEQNILPFLGEIIRGCPSDTLIKHPVILINVAYIMLWDGQVDTFQRLCCLISLAIENHHNKNQDDFRMLQGEFAFLCSFTEYNNIRKMNLGVREALSLLGGPSCIFDSSSIPWTFGSMSYLTTFWRESGKLEEELHDIDECMPDYYTITRGHNAGANCLMRAEAMLMRGEDNEAEILCYRALYVAQNYKQVSVCLYAEMILAQIAILRGDYESYDTSVTHIRNCVKENANIYIIRMSELCLSSLSMELGIKDNIAHWIYDIESISRVMYSRTSIFALLLYARLLLMDKRYNEFISISQNLIEKADKISPNAKFMMIHVYYHIFLTIAKYDNGDNLNAMMHLKKALSIALPDKVYLPFIQMEGSCATLLDSISGFSLQPKMCHDAAVNQNLNEHDTSYVEKKQDAWNELNKRLLALKALCIRHTKGVNRIRRAVLLEKSVLSPREREVACLSKDRLSPREISSKLFISEATVRTIQKSIYRKLNIHKKDELYKVEF